MGLQCLQVGLHRVVSGVPCRHRRRNRSPQVPSLRLTRLYAREPGAVPSRP
jgi:hypothetical protein